MNAKKIATLADTYRQRIGDAVANGDPIPVIESVFSLEVQKKLRKRYPDQVGDILDDLAERQEAAQEAIEALDRSVDMLELIGKLLMQAERLVAIEADLANTDELGPLVPETASAPADDAHHENAGDEDDDSDDGEDEPDDGEEE